MRQSWFWQTLSRLVAACGLMVLGALIAAVAGVALYLDSRPPLDVWHSVHLQEEFRAGTNVQTFAQYLALEGRLFKELETKVYEAVSPGDASPYARYHKGSRADPTSAPQDWNRSFELVSQSASTGVLLLHGLSDSPYSLRTLGQDLHNAGAHVVGLRVPGHGTAPSGLTTASFEDMAAAVDLAARHLREALGDKKLYIVGYSNGGALAVDYAVRAIQSETLPELDGLILLSPEIGISEAAERAAPLSWLDQTFGLQKLAWPSVDPEYDPYKYTSFALRADLTAFTATQSVQTRLQALQANGRITELPRILAFQSAADATVQAPALMSVLFDQLEGPGHHLVLFDVNQLCGAQNLLDGMLDVPKVLNGPPRRYTISAITNATSQSASARLLRKAAGAQQVTSSPLDAEWPKDTYSLAHVALPFRPDDPVYGDEPPARSSGSLVRFRDMPIYGERGTIRIPAAGVVRQHWNPFYSVMSDMILEFARP
ncbi:MAG: alpha/beta hydrolase [Pseudomonadota bacterium]